MQRFAVPAGLKPFVPWILLVLGTFTFQTATAKPFYISSESMMPGLQVGDRLIVSKYTYSYSYASLSIHGWKSVSWVSELRSARSWTSLRPVKP